MQHKIYPFPNVTVTKPMTGRTCTLCDHKPLFVEEEAYFQHMEEVHLIFRISTADLAAGKLGGKINEILASRPPSPPQPQKKLSVVLILGKKMWKLMEKMRFRYK